MFTKGPPSTTDIQRHTLVRTATAPAGDLQLIAANYTPYQLFYAPLPHRTPCWCSCIQNQNKSLICARRPFWLPQKKNTPTKKKRESTLTIHSIHARASAAIDESRLIGRYCLKGFQRPLPARAHQTCVRKRARGGGIPTALPKTERKKKGNSRRRRRRRRSSARSRRNGGRARESESERGSCSLRPPEVPDVPTESVCVH